MNPWDVYKIPLNCAYINFSVSNQSIIKIYKKYNKFCGEKNFPLKAFVNSAGERKKKKDFFVCNLNDNF